MRYFRLGFAALVLALGVGALLWLNRPQIPPHGKLPDFSDFQLTRVFPDGGHVYFDSGMTRPANPEKLLWKGHFELYGDPRTAFEFTCFGTVFVAAPGSSLTFDEDHLRLNLNSGDFSWTRTDGKRRVEVTAGDQAAALMLSSRGRLQVSDSEIRVWIYEGESSLTLDGGTTQLRSNSLFVKSGRRGSTIFPLLPAPARNHPQGVRIPLSHPDASVVKFTWQRVNGAANYAFRLYPSPLRQTLLTERRIPGNQLRLDLMVFGEQSDFYWEVAGVAQGSDMPGVPTRLGHVRLEGSLLGEKSVTRPPQLVITSLTVGGNMVLIKGEAESNSQLFVNGEKVKVDMDGKFIHTMTFRTIGVKTIEFRLVAPSETETVITRAVTIFEEGI